MKEGEKMNDGKEIRTLLKKYKMKQWELAARLDVTEGTLIRWLRTELPTEKKEQIMYIIKNYKGGE